MNENKINKFTHFQRHIDNAKEVIESKDINKIQESVNQQEEINIIKNENSFINKCLFILENHFAVNSGFVDELKDMQNIDRVNNYTVDFDFDDTSLIISPFENESTFYTTSIKGDANTAFLNDFLLLVDTFIPQGATIRYYISTDFGDYPIFPDKEKTTKIQEEILEFKLKISMTKNSLGESPKIHSLGVLFFDIFIEKKYGLINPDLSRFESQSFGETLLIRDRGLGDKLIRVIAPDSITDLIYRDDGKLDFIEAIEGQEETKTLLNYGDYFDSYGVISEKLLSISTKNVKTEDTEKSPFESGDDSEN